MKTFFDKIKDAGIPFDNHESDLYIPNTKEAQEILNQYPVKKEISSKFMHAIKQETWISIPFAYQPYWDGKRQPDISKRKAKTATKCKV